MRSRTETIERVYSKADLAKLKKISRKIKEAKKDPAYRRAIDEFIKETT